MDTRHKIIDSGRARELARQMPLTVVVGHYDAVLAADAQNLREVRNRTPLRPLLVAALPPAEPVLSERARLELLAALGMVDYVCTADETTLPDLIRLLPVEAVVRVPCAQDRTRQLMEHVHRRQST